eukprot:8252128-Pyramimonas_sp.AAC.1
MLSETWATTRCISRPSEKGVSPTGPAAPSRRCARRATLNSRAKLQATFTGVQSYSSGGDDTRTGLEQVRCAGNLN